MFKANIVKLSFYSVSAKEHSCVPSPDIYMDIIYFIIRINILSHNCCHDRNTFHLVCWQNIHRDQLYSRSLGAYSRCSFANASSNTSPLDVSATVSWHLYTQSRNKSSRRWACRSQRREKQFRESYGERERNIHVSMKSNCDYVEKYFRLKMWWPLDVLFCARECRACIVQ